MTFRTYFRGQLQPYFKFTLSTPFSREGVGTIHSWRGLSDRPLDVAKPKRGTIVMKRFLNVLSFIAIYGACSGALAHERHECSVGFPDAPAVPGHIEHADIVSGAFEFQEVVDIGRELFAALFNRCDGQGRPAATGTGAARAAAGQPAFIRTSGPDSDSCAGCHAAPRPGGAGDFVANVFVLAQALDPVTSSVAADFSDIDGLIARGEELLPQLSASAEQVYQQAPGEDAHEQAEALAARCDVTMLCPVDYHRFHFPVGGVPGP